MWMDLHFPLASKRLENWKNNLTECLLVKLDHPLWLFLFTLLTLLGYLDIVYAHFLIQAKFSEAWLISWLSSLSCCLQICLGSFFFVWFFSRCCFDYATFNAFDLCSPACELRQPAGRDTGESLPGHHLCLGAWHSTFAVTWPPLTSTRCPQQRVWTRTSKRDSFPETPGCSSVTGASYLPCVQADWAYCIALIHLNHQRVSFNDGLQVPSSATALAFTQH